MNVKTAQVALMVSRRDQIAADVERFRAEGRAELAGAASAILTIVDHVLAPALEGTPAPGQLRAVPDLEEG
jgi:hypothetical protein